ncbi:MAG TPA: carboxymuconolactone decarboxylase family protein, partial [Planctomycetota bacterium]|nr:carboxymuconolactone decarboxylase family protein [Planctomycetota bacterium]
MPDLIARLFARPGLDLPVRAVACAQVAVARAHWPRLEQTLRAAHAARCPRVALEEGLLQGILFYGFPRAITSFATLANVWPVPTPPRGGGLPPDEQPAAGRALFAAVYGGNTASVEDMLANLHGELHDFVVDIAYGRILSRPALPPRDRELAAVAVLAALDQTPQMVAHGRGALHFGADEGA